MTHPTRPATGPLIMERVINIENDVQAIRAALEQHTRVMTQRHTEIVAHLRQQEHTARYYGEELVRAYNRLNVLTKRLENKLDAFVRAEQEKEREKAA